MNDKEKELSRILSKYIKEISKQVRAINAYKKRQKKRMQNGSAFCGIKVQVHTGNQKEDQDDAVQDTKRNIVSVSKQNMGRNFTSTEGNVSVRMMIAGPDQAQGQGTGGSNQYDIQCCALFLTEPFGVPNNISSAIMRSDLVFDKALILNSFGQSSDPRVYAAGNIAKINRSTLLNRLTDTNSGFTFKLPFSPMSLTADPIKPVVSWSLYSLHDTSQYSMYELIHNRLVLKAGTGLVPEFARPLILNAKVANGWIFRVSRPLRDLRHQK